MSKDGLAIGLICDKTARVYAICGGELCQKAHETHGTSHVCTAALGRALMGSILLASMQKELDSDVSLVFKGGGPAGNIVCVGRADGTAKGYVANPRVELPPKNGKLDVGGAVGADGTLTVVRDLRLKEPYVGTVKLVSGEIAEDIARYLLASEQQESLFYLGVHVNPDGSVLSAGGILIQPLPGCPDSTISKIAEQANALQLLTTMLESELELDEVLAMLLKDMDWLPLETRTPAFACDCSREKLERAVIAMGADEIKAILEEDGQAELTCSFCNSRYLFDEGELKRLLALAGGDM